MINHKQLFNSARLLWDLILTNLIIFRKFIIADIINVLFWFMTIAFLASYVFQLMGMPKSFGPLMALTLVIGEGFWRINHANSVLIADLDGDRQINYYFTLPMPSWVVFLREILAHAIRALIFSGVITGLMFLTLGRSFAWPNLSIPKFCLIVVASCFFTGAFYIFISRFTKGMESVRLVTIRILFPLWCLGGAEFPWSAIHSAMPGYWSYLFLLNPLIYPMEGIHAAGLGQAGYLPFWLCFGMTWLMALAFGTIGIYGFKKRLDLV